MMPSIDELQRSVASMTAGPWKAGSWQYEMNEKLVYTEIAPSSAEDVSITVDDSKQGTAATLVIGGCGCCNSPFGVASDAIAIADLRNAAPALLEIVAAALAWRDSVAGTPEGERLAMALSAVRP